LFFNRDPWLLALPAVEEKTWEGGKLRKGDGLGIHKSSGELIKPSTVYLFCREDSFTSPLIFLANSCPFMRIKN
jgi:hypothetical protein